MAIWVEGLIQRESVPLLEAAMGFSFQRHLNIMNNIANVETPYYKRKVLPEEKFKRAMENALTERYRDHWNEFTPSNQPGVRFYQNHLPYAYSHEGREWGPERHDENNVVIEKEMADLAKNAAYMEALQQLFKNKTSSLKSALERQGCLTRARRPEPYIGKEATMETCDEATAKFMGEALLSHAREIHRYAKTFCLPTLANQAVAEGNKRRFSRNVERMINEMHALMLMAKYKGAERFCNREQIDAYMNEARAAIAPIVTAAPTQAEIGYSSPLFN